MKMENGIYNWIQEWVDRTSKKTYENSFNEQSDEWVEIEGVGKFKGLRLKTGFDEDSKLITINFTYDKIEKTK
jgi:hypothetical protein